jgi:predicted nucleotidyltransferase
MFDRELTEEELAVYRRTAERLREEDRPAERLRREKAWQLARAAADLLRQQFHVERVAVFGSLAAEERTFTKWSDVDIAAWGLDPKDTLRALGAVMDLSSDPMVNLVDVNTAKPFILAAIERDGVEL